MSIKSWNIVLFLALLAVLAGGAYVLYQNHETQLAKVAAEQARIAEEDAAKIAEAEDLAQGFEDALNGFLQDLGMQADEYKKRRKVLHGLIRPENLRSAEYVEENYNLGESTSLALQLQMESIIGLFDAANVKMKALIERLPERKKEAAAESWANIQGQQLETYMQFFDGEQAVITNIRALLSFYNEHKDEMSVDLEKGRILFSDIETQAAAFELTKALNAVTAKQP